MKLSEKFLELSAVGSEWILWILVGLSVVSVAVMIERVIFYAGVQGRDSALVRALHAALGCACAPVRHLEWFADHVRIERLFFAGAPQPVAGELAPDRGRPGLGLELRREEVERYRVAVDARE